MPRTTGKPLEWRVARELGDELSTTFQDYDWADEGLHARIGREWLLPEFGDREGLKAMADEARARWRSSRDVAALRSEQEPWWPRFVERARGVTEAQPRPRSATPE